MAGYRLMLRACLCTVITAFITLVLVFVAYSEPHHEIASSLPKREYDNIRDSHHSCPSRLPYGPQYFLCDLHDQGENGSDAPAHDFSASADIPHPIILWWTPFTLEAGTTRTCGNVRCFFTNDKKYAKHRNMKVFMFYGTGFNHTDLPLPRQPHHEWALLHEEAPHNQYMFSHGRALRLFNHTSTFRRESHHPISTQWLHSIRDLEQREYLVPTREKTRLHREGQLALVSYLQSDCGAMSDRDHVVKMLQRHLPVDSYGRCLHNKDLPENLQDPLRGMDHEDLYRLLGRYKFTLAMENGICDDYMTEKFWRPFLVGSVPVILGSPKARDFIPNNKSAIFLTDFENIEDLVKLIKHLDENEEEYDTYLEHKRSGVMNPMLLDLMKQREWSVGYDPRKPHYIPTFECFVCNRVHENIRRSQQKLKPFTFQADEDHYGCPRPMKFRDNPPGDLERISDDSWSAAWLTGKHMARALEHFMHVNKPGYTEEEFFDLVIQYYSGKWV